MIWTVILAESPYIVAGNHRMRPHASQLIDGKQGSTASKETYSQSPLSLRPQCVMLSQRCHKLCFVVWLVFMFYFSFLFFFSVLGMERRVLSVLGKHSTIESHSQALGGGGGSRRGSRQRSYYWAALPSSNPVLRTFRNRQNHRDRRHVHDELGLGQEES